MRKKVKCRDFSWKYEVSDILVTLEDKLIEDRAINIDVTRDVKEASVNIDTVCLSNETKENEENFYFYLRYFSDDVKDKYALIDISTKEVVICKIGDNYDVEDIPLKDLSKFFIVMAMAAVGLNCNLFMYG